MKETSKSIASLAARGLSGATLTQAENMKVYASCLAQCEAEAKGTRAWAIHWGGMIRLAEIYKSESVAERAVKYYGAGEEKVLPVLITPRPTASRKRKGRS